MMSRKGRFSTPVVLLIAYLLSGAARAENPYIGTYRSLMDAVYSASGRADIYLSPGDWETVWQGSNVQWRVGGEDLTGKPIERTTIAKATFKYEAGNLVDGRVEFAPPVIVKLDRDGQCLKYEIRVIQYGAWGKLKSPNMAGKKPEWRLFQNCRHVTAQWNNLQSHLEFSPNPSSLFLGVPFTSSTSAHRMGKASSQPMVTRVKFFPAVDAQGNEQPALEARFRESATIQIGRESRFVVTSRSGFIFSRFDYIVSSQEAEGELLDLTLDGHLGIVTAGESQLVFLPGPSGTTGVKLKTVKFDSKPRRITFTHGFVEAALGNNTILRLARTGSPMESFLRITTPSSVALRELSMIINDGQADVLSFDIGQFKLTCADGRFSLSNNDFIRLGHSTMTLELDRSGWAAGTGPRATGRVTTLDAVVTDGVLKPNAGSLLRIEGGEVKSRELTIDSSAEAPVTGAFETLDLRLARDSVLAEPGRFLLGTMVGARISNADTTKPVAFLRTNSGISGRVAATIPFKDGSLKLSSSAEISVPSGSISGIFNFTPGAPLQGYFAADLRDAHGTIGLNAATRVEIAEATVKSQRLELGGLVGITGKLDELAFKLRQGSEFALPRGFYLVTDAGARFEAKVPAQQVEFLADRPYPVGSYMLTIPFLRFNNDRSPQFSIHRGTASLTLANDARGAVTGTNCALSGYLRAVVDTSTFESAVSISNATITQEDGVPHLVASVSTSIPGDLSFPPITTEYVQDLDLGTSLLGNSTLFPLDLKLRLLTPIPITQAKFEIRGTVVNIEPISVSASVQIDVPSKTPGQGGGEHKDRLDLQQGTKDEPGNDYGTSQEALITDIKSPLVRISLSTVHLYLKPASYTVNTQATLKMVNSKLSVNFSGQLDRTLQIIRNGGSVAQWAIELGAVLSGPGGALIGGKLGDALDGIINDLIAKRVTERLNGRSFAVGSP